MLQKRSAQLTQNLSINHTSNGDYLSEPLDLYLDGQKIESLQISADLKGVVTTQVSIQGYGVGTTQQSAIDNATAQMKQLQTILQTGSLPFKLEIVQEIRFPSFRTEFYKHDSHCSRCCNHCCFDSYFY